MYYVKLADLNKHANPSSILTNKDDDSLQSDDDCPPIDEKEVKLPHSSSLLPNPAVSPLENIEEKNENEASNESFDESTPKDENTSISKNISMSGLTEERKANYQRNLTTDLGAKDRLIEEDEEVNEEEEALMLKGKNSISEVSNLLSVSNKTPLKPSDAGLSRIQDQFMKMSTYRNLDRSFDMNMEIDSVAKFILLKVANDYLANDFKYCIDICSKNLSYVAYCNLFEGNILRFKALALEKIYELRTTKE